jgi:hypothetical protein
MVADSCGFIIACFGYVYLYHGNKCFGSLYLSFCLMASYFSATFLKLVLSTIWRAWKKIGGYFSRLQSGLVLGLIYIFVFTPIKWIAFNKNKKIANEGIWQNEEDPTVDFNRPW